MVVPSLLLDLMVKKNWHFSRRRCRKWSTRALTSGDIFTLKRTLSTSKKREIIFFLLFIKFSIRSAVLLTVYIVLSFYFSLRGKNIRTSKFLTTSPQPYAEKKKSRCFCFKKIVATNLKFFFFFFRKIYRLIYTKTTWEVNMHSRFIVGCSRFQLAFDSFCQM